MPAGHVTVGRVGKPHGLNGEVFVFPESDHPERFAASAELNVGGRTATVATSRFADGRLIVRFSHVSDRAQAEAMRGAVVTIPELDRRPLEPDEWWPDQLVGLRVFDHSGVERGVVVAVTEGVAQDRLVVETEGRRVEVPFVEAVVPTVDIESGLLRLGPVEGLLTEE